MLLAFLATAFLTFVLLAFHSKIRFANTDKLSSSPPYQAVNWWRRGESNSHCPDANRVSCH